MNEQKLYCYVDETGQDTSGEFFLVSVIIVGNERDELRATLDAIEKRSGKGIKKWTKATRKQRFAYMQEIVNDKRFAHHISFSHYTQSRSYVDMTILSTAKAILAIAHDAYETIVYVDGMHRKEQRAFAAGLRKLRVRVRLVRGLTDQADEFIRLADAVAGFLRDSMEGDEEMRTLHDRATRNGVINKC